MPRFSANSVVADTNVVTTAETAAITSDPVSTSVGAEEITVSGIINITTGASTTQVVVRVRRGVGVAGTVVGETEPQNIGAAVSGNIFYEVTDTPGEVAGQQYTATAVQTAATGNGTINNAAITVMIGT